jgi:hypothetical protein
MHPEAVFVGGQIKLISLPLAMRLPQPVIRNLQPLRIEGRGQWLIDCDVPMLMEAGNRVLGEQFRLAGKAVAA